MGKVPDNKDKQNARLTLLRVGIDSDSDCQQLFRPRTRIAKLSQPFISFNFYPRQPPHPPTMSEEASEIQINVKGLLFVLRRLSQSSAVLSSPYPLPITLRI